MCDWLDNAAFLEHCDGVGLVCCKAAALCAEARTVDSLFPWKPCKCVSEKEGAMCEDAWGGFMMQNDLAM